MFFWNPCAHAWARTPKKEKKRITDISMNIKRHKNRHTTAHPRTRDSFSFILRSKNVALQGRSRGL